MNVIDVGTVKVPGATLRYETRGSGPVLLLVPGGAGDAGLFEGMAGLLADAGHTVVSYDQRGLSRSPLDGPLADQRVADWRDDALAVLDAVSPDEPAYVFGSSSGGIVALSLLAARPDRVRRLVAHEPPLVELLADPAPYRDHFAEVRELHRTQGLGPAMARFSETPDGRKPERQGGELPASLRPMASRMAANMPVFLEHVLVPFSSSAPDLEGLRAAAGKLVLGVGEESTDQEALVGPARRLAELTGAVRAEFPGGHVGCVEHPVEFAKVLVSAMWQ
ncbi:alpha/beta fold hydrolase [Streptomyces sp. TLI_105]|uniref:alpha/beta fold hydrolase n=1 Tax=Streptomyces sp. TLI_105 TaxID=1881019 RepID=UPI000894B886|nr:alpha/beta fold hydrolase [Streptomyces sp. TLI_105]SEC93451.1 Pimeloyl-ACP methyl ester carboxylesterase [Streptomyces sp. TLI_105]